ncbi:MAG: GNAT family protein [Burkholderiales bacterium]
MSESQTLSGVHVNLRPLAVDDAELTLRWRTSDRALHLHPGATTVAEQARWIATRPAAERNFVIERRDGRPVGMVSLTDIDTVNRHGMPGRFLIGDEAAVKGIPAAAEAFGLVLALAFDTLGLHRIHGTIASDNVLMIKWQKHIGLREEGRLRDHYFLAGHYQDAVCLGLLVDEYRAVTVHRLSALVRMARVPQS